MNLSRAILLPLGALGLAASLVACGSGSDTSSAAADAPAATSSSSPGVPAPQSTADQEQVRACLAEKGFTLPSRDPNAAPPTGAPTGAPQSGEGGGPGLPDGVDQQAMQEAMQACGGNFGGGFPGGAGGIGSTAFEAYNSCLSDNGVKMPTTGQTRTDLDQSDPKVSAAMKTCAPLMPSRQPAPAAS